MRTLVLLCLMAVACALLVSAAEPSAAAGAAAGAPSAPAAAAATTKVPTYYELLGVTPGEAADAAFLKKAYRRQALLHHPDRAGASTDDAAKSAMHAVFVRLANAFETLSSRRMRVRYDWLLTQGETEYDGTRDWGDFDVAHGFKRKITKAQQQAEFKFKEAYETFKREAEEAEEVALWSALSIALLVALLPAGYMAYSRWSSAQAARSSRKERSSELKASQNTLAQLQAEQAREAARSKQEAYEHQRELRLAREAAAAEAAAEAASEAEAASAAGPSAAAAEGSPDSEWEVLRKDGAAAAAAEEGNDDDDDDDEDEGSSKVVLKCVPCKKSFKSQQQLDNHEQSNQHKKNMREADKGNRKKSRKDE